MTCVAAYSTWPTSDIAWLKQWVDWSELLRTREWDGGIKVWINRIGNRQRISVFEIVIVWFPPDLLNVAEDTLCGYTTRVVYHDVLQQISSFPQADWCESIYKYYKHRHFSSYLYWIIDCCNSENKAKTLYKAFHKFLNLISSLLVLEINNIKLYTVFDLISGQSA